MADPASSNPTWRYLSLGVRSFAQSEVKQKACLLVSLLVLLMIGTNGLNVVNSYVGRDFISAIEAKNYPGFVAKAWLYFGVFMASTLVAVIFRFVEERLGLLWRHWLTGRLVALWLEKRAYLRLHQTKEIANPDQNISEDVKAFTTTSLSFFLMLLNGGFSGVAFSIVLWKISPQLFFVAVVYASAGTILTVLLGKPLIGLNYKQLDREADFRDDLVMVRENADSIAMLKQEEGIRAGLLERLDALVANARRIISVNRNLGLFTTGYNYLIQLLPALIVAPMFISNKTDFGTITQSAMAFAQLMGAFSLIVTQFQSISSYGAVITRLGKLVDAVQNAATHAPALIEVCEDCNVLGFEHVTLRSHEDDHILVKDLTLTISKGTHVLMDGDNEAARLALFRAISGGWEKGEGKVTRPSEYDIAYLTERPYMHSGSSLREAMVLPQIKDKITDDAIRVALRAVGAEHVLTKAMDLDRTHDWDDLLSLGGQQLVLAARLLLCPVSFAVLDRIDTALTQKEVNRVIDALKRKGITCVTFGNRADDLSMYDYVLDIDDDGTWTYRKTEDIERAQLVD